MPSPATAAVTPWVLPPPAAAGAVAPGAPPARVPLVAPTAPAPPVAAPEGARGRDGADGRSGRGGSRRAGGADDSRPGEESGAHCRGRKRGPDSGQDVLL